MYRNEKSDLNGNKDDAKESSNTSDEIELIDLEDQNSSLDIDQRNHSVDDDSCEDGVWSVLKERSEEEQCQENDD